MIRHIDAIMPVARIYFVRHGETEENRRGIIQGHLDTKLNAAGLRQSDLVAEALQSVPFEKAYSSDLIRAVKVRVSGSFYFTIPDPGDLRLRRSFLNTTLMFYFTDSRSFERR